MATKLKEFVTKLAQKAGFDIASDGAKAFLESLNDVDVPEDVQKGIDNSLISLSEAKNNYPELKNHYTKQALDGVDKEYVGLMDAFSLDDAARAEILAEKSTYKRGPMLTRKIVELERQKVATTGGKDKQEIQKQIDDLHAALKLEKEGRAADKSGFDAQILENHLSTKKNLAFSGLKTIHDDLDPETRFTILDSQVKKALQDNGAKFVLNEQGEFILLRNDGTNYFGENHQQIKPAQFIEQILAKNKQLKVSPPPGAPGTKPTAAQPSGSNGGDGGKNGNASLIERNKQALADLEAAGKNGSFSGMM